MILLDEGVEPRDRGGFGTRGCLEYGIKASAFGVKPRGGVPPKQFRNRNTGDESRRRDAGGGPARAMQYQSSDGHDGPRKSRLAGGNPKRVRFWSRTKPLIQTSASNIEATAKVGSSLVRGRPSRT